MTAPAPVFGRSGDLRVRAGTSFIPVITATDRDGKPVDFTAREVFYSFYDRQTEEELLTRSAMGAGKSVPLPVVNGDDLWRLRDSASRLRLSILIGFYVEQGYVELSEGQVTIDGAPRTLVANSIDAAEEVDLAITLPAGGLQVVMKGAPGLTPWAALGKTLVQYQGDLEQLAIDAAKIVAADAGDVAGATAGAASGAIAGDASGKVAGAAAGTVAGDASGKVAGEAAGTIAGDASGKVAGAAAGTVAGDASGKVAGAAAGAAAVQPSIEAANTATTNANTKGNYAKDQGDLAATKAAAAQVVVDAGATILAAKDVAVGARDDAQRYAADASTAVSGRVLSVTVRRVQRTPLARDDAGNVPLWLEDGLLGALGLSSRLIKQTGVTLGIDQANPRSTFLLPIARDGSGNVALWLDNGALGARALSPILMRAIAASIPFTPISASPSAGQSILRTDGRSLWSWRARVATLESGQVVPLRLGLTGDSWIDQMRIPLAISALAFGQWGRSGDGWISIGSQRVGAVANTVGGYTVTRTGAWTTFDGAPSSASAIAMPATGIGPDGYAATVTTATATYQIANVIATRLRIFYFDNDATFRWRIDGGAWTVVTGGSTNARKVVTIDGLTDAAHTLDIDTTGNTSTLSLHGFTAERPNAGGVCLFQMGNGDAAGVHYTSMASQIAGFSAALALDVLAIILGTNDHNRTLGTAQYVQGLTDIITAHRSANPELPMILVAPAQGGLARTPTMATYRDAARDLAKTLGVEFVSLTDHFGPYASENARGQWTDTSHLSDIAARRAAAAVFALLKG